MFKRLIASVICLTFSISNLQYANAQGFSINQLPVPGTMVGESAPFAPLALKGLVVNPQKPLEFQFIVDTGEQLRVSVNTTKGPQDTASIKDQANQLVKYFLAGLTIPEGDLWVNLSPYEKNRMVPEALGQTDLGRDLLAQDYILKQLTASLIYPEKDLGKEFWSRVYAKAQQQFGTTNVPVNTFNKVWILPDQAQVFENVNAAYVTKSTLKVMLDEDYLALQKHSPSLVKEGVRGSSKDTHRLASQIVREIVLPEITKEVNTGKNFAPLRQIYQALILAKWYKETIQNGLLDAIYTNKNKVAGVNLNDPAVKEQIYDRYLKAYKKGAFNYIKEDPSPDGQVVPRKYFSGGFKWVVKLNHKGTPAMISASIKGLLLALTFSLTAFMSSGSIYAQKAPTALAQNNTPIQNPTVQSQNKGQENIEIGKLTKLDPNSKQWKQVEAMSTQQAQKQDMAMIDKFSGQEMGTDQGNKGRASFDGLWNDNDTLGSMMKIFDVKATDPLDSEVRDKIIRINGIMRMVSVSRQVVMKKILKDFVELYGIDFLKLPRSNKKMLLTIVEKISGEPTYQVWSRLVREVSNSFGIEISEISGKDKQQMLTDCLYIARGKKKQMPDGRYVSIYEKYFQDTIVLIQKIFGIGPEELKKKESQGGLKLSEKFQIIVAAYNVSLGKAEGLATFEKTIERIRDIFGIDPDELKKKESEGGLKLGWKFQIIVAAYATSIGKAAGLATFEKTIERIGDIFGIGPDELKKKESQGGLKLGEKFQIIVAAYATSLGKAAGLATFEKTIERIGDIFGIDPDELKKKESQGGFKLGEKFQIIVAAYNVSLGRAAGLAAFEKTIERIGDIFGIGLDELKKKESQGGLKLGEKFQIIVAAYETSSGKAKRLATFEKTIKRIGDIFGIDPDELKKKESQGGLKLGEKFQIIVAAYNVSLRKAEGLATFEKTIKRIRDIFGIGPDELKKKESQGGLKLSEKFQIIAAAYHVSLGKAEGLATFEKTIERIRDIFGINPDELKKIESRGGLKLGEKFQIIAAAYHVSLGKAEGLATFEKTIERIRDIFGIGPDELKKKESEGGLKLSEKFQIIVAAYATSIGKAEGLATFEKTIERIRDIFGIGPDELKKKESEGGLKLSEKFQIIVAAYHVSLSKAEGLATFEKTIERIGDIFGIGPDELKKKESQGGLKLGEKFQIIVAAYQTSFGKAERLATFEKTIERIRDIFGIGPDELKKKESEGGLKLSEKFQIIVAAYNVSHRAEGLAAFENNLIRLKGNRDNFIMAEVADIVTKSYLHRDGFTIIPFPIETPFIPEREPDSAQIASDETAKGGIDLNQINVKRTGKTVNVQFDPAQLTQLEQDGFDGFTPVITGFQYIKSPFALLGINTVLPERLAKV